MQTLNFEHVIKERNYMHDPPHSKIPRWGALISLHFLLFFWYFFSQDFFCQNYKNKASKMFLISLSS
jgi:hypothetical protein